ncbi:Ca2+ regulator and membrane fusion protein Fig1-domain-containing protein [Immersiella caudata]|uniref:Ca2+ regulator and membrane fusion protein Fig1-domain-containing protein n=1 Tax=Immersiella caudata TaxID=314043 RepID=A0AA40C399_9PEZI|nr:Ca2+ regulator and membrane fusion protein Fig1-domain-containing protein [Immersiella caudata]
MAVSLGAQKLWQKTLGPFGHDVLHRLASLRKPVQLLNCGNIVLLCLLLSSCSVSNFLANIYLFSFIQPPSPEQASYLEVRVGYFSLCATTDPTTSWTCGRPDSTTAQFQSTNSTAHSQYDILKTAYDIQNEVVSPAALIITLFLHTLSLLVLSSFPLPSPPTTSPPRHTYPGVLHPTRLIIPLLLLIPFFSIHFALIAALWQHAVAGTAVSLARRASGGGVNAEVGGLAVGLVWLRVVGAFGVGVVEVVVGRKLLRRGSYVVLRDRDWVERDYGEGRVEEWVGGVGGEGGDGGGDCVVEEGTAEGDGGGEVGVEMSSVRRGRESRRLDFV